MKWILTLDGGIYYEWLPFVLKFMRSRGGGGGDWLKINHRSNSSRAMKSSQI